MNYGFRVEISGDTACFTRLELKAERVSYEVITPSAARGILEAALWKPAIRYVIDEIAVCNPIRFDNIRRNEVSFHANTLKPKAATENRVQRATMLLKNVRYVVTAHFKMTPKADKSDNEGKFADMIRRRLKKGQCFHTPYLGMREFPARLRLLDDEETISPINETRDLGLMLYDNDYIEEVQCDGALAVVEFKPTYFRAQMNRGVIDLRNVEVLR